MDVTSLSYHGAQRRSEGNFRVIGLQGYESNVSVSQASVIKMFTRFTCGLLFGHACLS